MLIQKPLDQGDIVSIKLITGEEILGRFDSVTDNELHIKKPCTLAMGNQGMGIVPWMMTTQPDITKLNKNTVIAYAPTDKEIAKAYVEATSSIKLA
jgi:hypothetical protein